jgi:hypothetical protein
VTELVSMLVPLLTQPSWLHVLGLLLGVPAIIFIVISILTKSKQFIQAARGQQPPDPSEPIWIGEVPPEPGTGGSGGAKPELVTGRRAAADEVGGASVRW